MHANSQRYQRMLTRTWNGP